MNTRSDPVHNTYVENVKQKNDKNCTICLPDLERHFKATPVVILGIWQGDKIIKLETKGTSNIMTNEPMSKNMIMRIGSITKTFTTTVILKLVSDGLLTLDDPAYIHLDPSYGWHKKFPKNITVKQLGNMTSGLFEYTNDYDFLRSIDLDQKKRMETR